MSARKGRAHARTRRACRVSLSAGERRPRRHLNGGEPAIYNDSSRLP